MYTVVFWFTFRWILFPGAIDQTSSDSDNGLAPTRRQAIIRTNICFTRPRWVKSIVMNTVFCILAAEGSFLVSQPCNAEEITKHTRTVFLCIISLLFYHFVVFLLYRQSTNYVSIIIQAVHALLCFVVIIGQPMLPITLRLFLWHPWWRHQMETFSALLALCAGNSPVTGEFPTQRPVTRSFDVFFDLYLNKLLSKQSWAGDLRRHRTHYDVIVMGIISRFFPF